MKHDPADTHISSEDNKEDTVRGRQLNQIAGTSVGEETPLDLRKCCCDRMNIS